MYIFNTFVRRVATMPRLVLYKRDASPPSNAVLMVADILGLQLEYYEPALLQLEHKTPAYRKLNPMGTIPVLKDGDFVVSESHAIIYYLLNKYGGDKTEELYPSEAEFRARVDERLFFDSGVFFIKLKDVTLPALLLGLKEPSERNLSEIEDAYHTLELYLDEYKYVAGDRFTIADICVGSTATSIQAILKLDRERFPKTSAWLDRIQEEPCFKKIGSAGAATFKKMLHYFLKKNNETD